MENEYRMELRDVSKSFGEVKSLRNVDFKLGQNEVVGLLGDNGAGKSTMIKVMTGYHQPTTGEILFNGKVVDHLTVPKARDLGVETVYQERALAELQTLWRNIFLGRELKNKVGLLDVGKMRDETNRLMTESMGFTSYSCIARLTDHTFFRWRETGCGHRAGALFRRRHHHPG